MRFFFGHIHFSLRFGLTIRPSSSPSFRSPTIYYCAPDTILTKGKTLRLVESKGLAAERWPSAAARDQHSSREEKGYLRSMLSRRQLQAIVRRRHIQRSFSASTSMILPTGAAHAAQLKILYVDQCGNQQSVGPPEKSRMRATYFPHPVAISLILGDCLRESSKMTEKISKAFLSSTTIKLGRTTPRIFVQSLIENASVSLLFVVYFKRGALNGMI
jgi:hypothetical protein